MLSGSAEHGPFRNGPTGCSQSTAIFRWRSPTLRRLQVRQIIVRSVSVDTNAFYIIRWVHL